MDLCGVYKGFLPTDQSCVGMGELEMVILDDTVSFRFATGLEVKSGQMIRGELREMTADELASYLVGDGVTGYVLGECGPTLLFFSAESPGVMMYDYDCISHQLIGTYHGLCALFTPGQVEAGCFERAVIAAEEGRNNPGGVPRIANNGRRG